MHFLYIIYSQAADRFYSGETADLEKRLREHNYHRYRKGFSKMAEDWKIVLKLEEEEKEKAVYLERYIKKMKSRKFTEKVILNPVFLRKYGKIGRPWFPRSIGAGGTTIKSRSPQMKI